MSVRAVAGTLFSFLVFGPYRFLFTDPSTIHHRRSCRGEGWRLSQFYRRRSSFREEEAQSAPSSPAFGHGRWRLTKLRAAVVESQRLRSQEEEDLRRRLRLFEEEVSGGSRRACLRFPVVHRRKRSRSTIELSDGKTRRRRSPMARRLCRLGVPAKSCDGG
ncbi:hypothetical protein YC2023_058033 [Brassica napus]